MPLSFYQVQCLKRQHSYEESLYNVHFLNFEKRVIIKIIKFKIII